VPTFFLEGDCRSGLRPREVAEGEEEKGQMRTADRLGQGVISRIAAVPTKAQRHA